MARQCLSCSSPHNREIDRRLRAGTPHVDIALWLESVGAPIDRTSIGRHAKHVAGGAVRERGPRKPNADFLRAVVDAAHEDLESGALSPSIRDGIGAQAELNRQADRSADRDLMVKIALALGGDMQPVVIEDPDYLEIEAEFAEVLALPSGGTDYTPPSSRERYEAEKLRR